MNVARQPLLLGRGAPRPAPDGGGGRSPGYLRTLRRLPRRLRPAHRGGRRVDHVRHLRAVSRTSYRVPDRAHEPRLHRRSNHLPLIPALTCTLHLAPASYARFWPPFSGGDVGAFVHPPRWRPRWPGRYSDVLPPPPSWSGPPGARRASCCCEGEDPRVRAAAERLRKERLAEPDACWVAMDGIRPRTPAWVGTPRFLRSSVPTGYHDVATRCGCGRIAVNFGRRSWRWAADQEAVAAGTRWCYPPGTSLGGALGHRHLARPESTW